MIVASIDPGATSGIVIVALPEKDQTIFRSVGIARQSMYNLDDARLVRADVIKTLGKAQERSASARRRPLLVETRQMLDAYHVNEVVIERPADIILGGFRSDKRSKGGEAQDTAFGIGNHFGLLEAAALDARFVERVHCYQIRSHKVRGGEFVIGWMQRREKKCPPRENTLMHATARMRDLVKHPYDGILRKAGPGSVYEDENVLMALGVLAFHCDRERGRV
jgi:hypothetical protein